MRPLYYIEITSSVELIGALKAIGEKHADLLILSDHLSAPNTFPLNHAKSLLGTSAQSIIFDARFGFALDYFLAVAHTIANGNVLYILHNADEYKDEDSARFHDHTIITPNFNHYLNAGLKRYGYQIDLSLTSVTEPTVKMASKKTPQISAEQRDIINDFLSQKSGIFTLFSPRGTGKSWIGNELVKKLDHHIITAPNQNALFLYHSNNTPLNFYAPDFLIATRSENAPSNKVLIIEEAARMPLAHISALAVRFNKVLIISSIDNYEGTGQGLRSKLADLIPLTKSYPLTKLYRFQSDDPLAQFCAYLSMQSLSTDQPQRPIENGIAIYQDESLDTFRKDSQNIIQFYQLMNRTHYQTNAQDIRRLMDAEKQVLVSHYKDRALIAGIWAMMEGGLPESLSWEVFNGLRRPKGNLVAQTLSAHSYYPECMQMQSLRISRISVDEPFRRQNRARLMIEQLIERYKHSLDFISTSFGLTDDLKKFWEQCGFTWIHIGTHRDKTTGLHAAIMIYPLSQRGKDWLNVAKEKWQQDAFHLKSAPFLSTQAKTLLPESHEGGAFDPLDAQIIAAYKNARKPKEAIFCALKR